MVDFCPLCWRYGTPKRLHNSQQEKMQIHNVFPLHGLGFMCLRGTKLFGYFSLVEAYIFSGRALLDRQLQG